jgi:hypothetical protein
LNRSYVPLLCNFNKAQNFKPALHSAGVALSPNRNRASGTTEVCQRAAAHYRRSAARASFRSPAGHPSVEARHGKFSRTAPLSLNCGNAPGIRIFIGAAQVPHRPGCAGLPAETEGAKPTPTADHPHQPVDNAMRPSPPLLHGQD